MLFDLPSREDLSSNSFTYCSFNSSRNLSADDAIDNDPVYLYKRSILKLARQMTKDTPPKRETKETANPVDYPTDSNNNSNPAGAKGVKKIDKTYEMTNQKFASESEKKRK